jgi:hypothetical protein
MDEQTQSVFAAIDQLPDASAEEKDALKQIFQVEGFGGAEDHDDHDELARERLAWLRQQRAEGLR